MKYINWIKRFCNKNNLEFKEFVTATTIQYRVQIGNKFIDFWPNGSFRDVKGNFHRRGASERGYGADHVNLWNSNADDGCGFLEAIKEEIINLSQIHQQLTTAFKGEGK